MESTVCGLCVFKCNVFEQLKLTPRALKLKLDFKHLDTNLRVRVRDRLDGLGRSGRLEAVVNL